MATTSTVAATPGLLSPSGGFRRSSPARQACQWLAVAALAFISYLGFSRYLVQSIKVVGVSMQPTLTDSQRYLLNRWVLHVRTPHTTDIVVLSDPLDHGFSVKRVIAGPGDSVYIQHGKVYVNGKELVEPYLRPGTATFPSSLRADQLFKCGRDEYFVMGDNRNYSVDSRAYGPVSKSNLLGLIMR